MNIPINLPIVPFLNQQEWDEWLGHHYAESKGIWLKIAKKDSGIASITYPEALETAIRYGWIDGQKGSIDEVCWLQKFTPRGPRSIWSKINREHAEQLIAQQRMKPSGLAQVEQARADGRWEKAYDSQRNITVPSDFQAELNKYTAAKDFFATLNSTNRYAMLFRIQTAKKLETRAKRIKTFIEMLEKGEKLYP